MNLLIRCPSAREAVLDFYWRLFDEYCDQHFAGHAATGDPVLRRCTGLLARLKASSARPPADGGVEGSRKLSVEARKVSTDSSGANDLLTTPQSPPPAGQAEPMEEAAEEKGDNSLDLLLDRIGEALLTFSGRQREDPSFSRIATWALELMSSLSSRYSPPKSGSLSSAPSLDKLSDTIRHWLDCRVAALLLKLVLNSMALTSSGASGASGAGGPASPATPSTDYPTVVGKLIQFSPHSDWITAHLITCIPASQDMSSSLSSCIETLLKSTASPASVTSILSYLSEHNPRAIINSSKSNIPFLLKLCANSKPLLNVLAAEATKQSKPRVNKTKLHIDNVSG